MRVNVRAASALAVLALVMLASGAAGATRLPPKSRTMQTSRPSSKGRRHYDNPAIDGDEETGSPKFGYAVSFPVANTDQRAVIGSGIYIDTDGE